MTSLSYQHVSETMKDPFLVGRFACEAREDEPVISLLRLSHDERLALLDTVQNGELLDMFGFCVRVSELHKRPKELDQLREQGDPLGDAAVRVVAAVRRGELHVADGSTATCQTLSSIDILEQVASQSTDAAAFLASVQTVPSWVDVKRIRNAQRLFSENAAAFSLNMLNLALIGGFGAPKINKVLDATGYLTKSREITFRRLSETMQMVIDCVSPDALCVGSQGWKSVVSVRLLHASVRTWLTDSGHWNVCEYGVPINQEDMMVTQLAFSIVLLLGMERLGVTKHITTAEMNDFIHMWRYIGYLIGISEANNAHMDDIHTALRMLESISAHLVYPDAGSKRIALHVIDAVSFTPPGYRNHFEVVALTRKLAGDAYADSLGVPRLDSEEMYALWRQRMQEDGLLSHDNNTTNATNAHNSSTEHHDSDANNAVYGRQGHGAGHRYSGGYGLSTTSAADLRASISSTSVSTISMITTTWLSTIAIGALLSSLFMRVITLFIAIRRKLTRLRHRRGRSDKSDLAADAEIVANATIKHMQIFPVLVRLPIVGKWVVAGVMSGIRAVVASQLGGRTDFRIKLLPKSQPPVPSNDAIHTNSNT